MRPSPVSRAAEAADLVAAVVAAVEVVVVEVVGVVGAHDAGVGMAVTVEIAAVTEGATAGNRVRSTEGSQRGRSTLMGRPFSLRAYGVTRFTNVGWIRDLHWCTTRARPLEAIVRI